jgi:hypothetical protein
MSRMWRAWATSHRVRILTILILALAFYAWTAGTSIPFSFSSQDMDVYNLLTTAFLHGHTYLPIKPPAGLLHLSHPYDPAYNAAYSNSSLYHDLSLRNGHFYSSWGPTPALTLFLGFRITGLRMSESLAVVLFGFVGLVCATVLLHQLVRRLLPDTPNWLLIIATVALALTNVLPFLLRRPAQYEVAISGGYCFEMAGLLLVVSAVMATPLRRRRLALGSLCLGLAVGCRPSLVLGGAVAIVASVYAVRKRGGRYSLLVYALGPLLVCGLLLAIYNQVRFGAVGEFGEHYQLAGLDTLTKPADQLAYVPPGLFSYLLVPARLALTFPHAFLMTATEYPGSLPAGYAGTPAGGAAEPAGGILTTMPITLILLALPFLWWRRRQGEGPTLVIAIGASALGLAVMVLLSYALWGTTQRYEVDFATLFLIPAFLVWAFLLARSRRQRVRRAIAVGGVALTAFGAAVGTAVSFTGYYDTLRLAHPGTFKTLEDITSPFATLVTMVAGKAALVRVDTGALPVSLPPAGYGTFGERGADAWLGTNPVTVTVVAPHAGYSALRATPVPGPGAPPLAALAVRVRSWGQEILVPAVGLGHIPVHLHWGLNRITLSLAGSRATTAEELALNDIELGH